MRLAGVLVVALGLAASGCCSHDDVLERFGVGFNIFHTTGERTEDFQDILDEYALSDAERNSNWQYGNLRAPRVGICVLCNLAVSTALEAWDLGAPIDEIAAICTDLCISLNLYPARVCNGTVNLNINVMEYILNNTAREYLTSKRLCAITFQGDGCGEDDPTLEWSVDLGDTEKPPVVDNPAEPRETVSIMHVTDIHYDPNYLIGGNVDCGEPMCCRFDQGLPEFQNASAGRWGEYTGCDLPWGVVTDAMAHIQATHQLDYIYTTGDYVDSGVWETTIPTNIDIFVKIFNLMKKTFKDVPVFPCVGNHEPSPLNVFAPGNITQENVSTRWMYEVLADLWSAWLPADTRETILRGGFYTVLARPGFRVVALNNQQCYGNNWFLFYDQQDPDGQLKWLIDVLLAAEANDEKVHLLYHIPTGRQACYYRWSREFNRIVDRFEGTITGHFTGHTHSDEFQLFFSLDEPDRAINVMFGGGSLVPNVNVNPNYKMYSVDADRWNVVDSESWIYNLTEANLSPENNPRWYRLYSFREAFGVPSLSPADLDVLAHEMAADDILMQQYHRYYYKNADPRNYNCDLRCQNELLCQIVSSDTSNSTHCEQIIIENEQNYKLYG